MKESKKGEGEIKREKERRNWRESWKRRRRGNRLENDQMTMEKEHRENEGKEDDDDGGIKKGNKVEKNEMKVK
jgi:hypothetical protein